LVIVALWHWETLNGHGGTIRPLVACFIEVSRITAPSGRWVCQNWKQVKVYSCTP